MTKLDVNLTREELGFLQNVNEKDLVWVEIGVTGVGKSTLGNFLLGKDAFKVGSGLKSVTDKAQVDCSVVHEQHFCIVDTPGLRDTRHMGTKNTKAEDLAVDMAHLIVELSKIMLMARHGIHAFFVVVRADNRDLSSTMNLLDLFDILGNYWNHSILVFTHGKEFDKTSEEKQYKNFEEMLNSTDCPSLWKELIENVSRRFVIVEPEDWKDYKKYHERKVKEFENHSSDIVAARGPYNDTLLSLVQVYIDTAKLELRHEFSDVNSSEAQFAALQVAFHNITAMLHKIIRIKLAGGVDNEQLQMIVKTKEEELAEAHKQKDELHKQFLKEQEGKRKAQEAAERAEEAKREAEREAKAKEEERRVAREAEEKARMELEEYLKKPTFNERLIEVGITQSNIYNWKRVHTAEAEDVGSGIRTKAKNFASKHRAMDHARAKLKAILLDRGIIRKD